MVKQLRKMILPLIVSKNISLDIIRLKDKTSFFTLIDSNRHHLCENIPWINECQTINDAQAYIEDSLKNFEYFQTIRLGIFFSEKLIGSILVTAYWEQGAIELGYWIDFSSQGKGIVTTSCAAVLDAIYKEFGVKNAIIRCGINNIKSQSVAKRLGFIQQETLTYSEGHPNHTTDEVAYRKVLP